MIEEKEPAVFAFSVKVRIKKGDRETVAASCSVTDSSVILRNALGEEDWSTPLAAFDRAQYRGAMPGGAEDWVEMLPGPVVLRGPKEDPGVFGGTELFRFCEWVNKEASKRRQA